MIGCMLGSCWPSSACTIHKRLVYPARWSSRCQTSSVLAWNTEREGHQVPASPSSETVQERSLSILNTMASISELGLLLIATETRRQRYLL